MRPDPVPADTPTVWSHGRAVAVAALLTLGFPALMLLLMFGPGVIALWLAS